MALPSPPIAQQGGDIDVDQLYRRIALLESRSQDSGAVAITGGTISSTLTKSANTIAVLGDSRAAQGGGSPTGSTGSSTWNFFLHAGNAIMGHALTDVGNFSLAGNRSDQTLAYLPLALAKKPGFLLIWLGVNDILQGFTDVDAFSNIKSMADAAIAAGIRPILTTEAGSTTGVTSAQLGYYAGLNERLREYCEVTPGAILFDEAKSSLNKGSTTVGFKSGYSADGTHRTNLGGYMGGVDFAALMTSIIPAYSGQVAAYADNFVNNPRQLVNNGFFTTATGGTASTNATGTVPSGFTALGNTGATVTVSTSANADGYGNDVVLAMTGGANNSAWFRLDSGISTANIANGDILQGMCEIDIVSPVNLQGVFLSLDLTVGGQSYAYFDGYSTVQGGGINANVNKLVLRTPAFTVPAGSVTAITMRVQAGFSATSGSVTVNTRKWTLRKRFA